MLEPQSVLRDAHIHLLQKVIEYFLHLYLFCSDRLKSDKDGHQQFGLVAQQQYEDLYAP